MNGITTRRTFLKQSSATVTGIAVGAPALHTRRARVATHVPRVDPVLRVETDPAVRALAHRAVDAAKRAGATYADVRLTRTLMQDVWGGLFRDVEDYAVGVRALVGGAWGFASSPYWAPDEMDRLAQSAVAQAKANAVGAAGAAELAPAPAASGSWVMPVQIDPFTVPIEQRAELMQAWETAAGRIGRDIGAFDLSTGAFNPFTVWRQERALATSEGADVTQTVYRSACAFSVTYQSLLGPSAGLAARGLGEQAAGWELLLDAQLDAQLEPLIAGAKELLQLRTAAKPGDIGKYDVVFDAVSMAALVDGTLGTPTQLDRALGYEANASGTSYLTDPLGMVGSYQMGSPLLNVTADRSTPRSLAWVKWDDEGVEPDTCTLIKDGVLVDFQTTRALAPLLAPYYQKLGRPVRSHGCAGAETAADVTLQQAPNLTLAPGPEDITFNDLVRDTTRGLAVFQKGVDLDFQGRNGITDTNTGYIREIVNGQLGAIVTNLECLFSSSELWKNLKVLGGAATAGTIGYGAEKGQPAQTLKHTVRAVPAKVTGLAFVDPSRRG